MAAVDPNANKIKYIGEAALSNKPSKNLVLLIKDGSVTSSKIADEAVTNSKIADNAITDDKIAAGQINSNHIASNAILPSHLSNSVMTNVVQPAIDASATELRQDIQEITGFDSNIVVWKFDWVGPTDADINTNGHTWSELEAIVDSGKTLLVRLETNIDVSALYCLDCFKQSLTPVEGIAGIESSSGSIEIWKVSEGENDSISLTRDFFLFSIQQGGTFTADEEEVYPLSTTIIGQNFEEGEIVRASDVYIGNGGKGIECNTYEDYNIELNTQNGKVLYNSEEIATKADIEKIQDTTGTVSFGYTQNFDGVTYHTTGPMAITAQKGQLLEVVGDEYTGYIIYNIEGGAIVDSGIGKISLVAPDSLYVGIGTLNGENTTPRVTTYHTLKSLLYRVAALEAIK